MADIFSKEKRSEIMSKIRSKNTGIERSFCRQLSKELYPKGYRYRKHCKKLPGSPDIAFLKYKVAVFIDGDFWHGYKFQERKRKLPKKYWTPKIERNMQRDKQNARKLKKMGWKVIRIWEHQIKRDIKREINRIIDYLDKNS